MKKLEWLTLPVALVLTTIILVASALLIGVPVWLVVTGRNDSSLISVPIATLMSLLGACALYFKSKVEAAYLKGKMELPPKPDGTEWALIPSSFPPPPTEAELLGFEVPNENL